MPEDTEHPEQCQRCVACAAPEHTCGREVGQPRKGCPGCEHSVTRFGQLWPLALTCAVEGEDGKPLVGDEDTFHDVFTELFGLGLLPSVWFTCAVAIVQLADGPVRVDRAKLWGNLLDADIEPGLPDALDLVDELLLATGIDDLESCYKLLLRLSALSMALQAAVQLTLAASAHDTLYRHLSRWQMVLHTFMIGDVRQAMTRPQEILYAARITGARLDGDRDQCEQLATRASRQGFLGGVMLMWARHCAARMIDPDKITIMSSTADGVPDYVLNTHADLDTTDDEREQGYMLAARAIRAVAADDSTLGKEVSRLLEEVPSRARAMVMAMSAWHAAICKEVWGESIRAAQPDGGGVSS